MREWILNLSLLKGSGNNMEQWVKGLAGFQMEGWGSCKDSYRVCWESDCMGPHGKAWMPREVVNASFTEVFKAMLDEALGNLI